MLSAAATALATGSSTALNTVKQFSTHLNNWSNPGSYSTGSADYSPRQSIHALLKTNPAFRMDTRQLAEFAVKYKYPTSKSYDAKNFDDIFVEAISNGAKISISNPTFVPEDERDPNYTQYAAVICDFHVANSNIATPDEQCAFILDDDGKILKLTHLEMQKEVDKKTGKRRMKVDMDDVFGSVTEAVEKLGVDETYLIATLNYNKFFPLGVSINAGASYFLFGLDLGYRFPSTHVRPMVDYSENYIDSDTYTIKNSVYRPTMYTTFNVGTYMKYFSLTYGFGAVYLSGSTTTEENSPTTYRVSKTSDTKYKFMMKPSIKGHIPVSEKIQLTLSLSYNWVPKYKSLNSLDFGIGIVFLKED